MIKKTTCVVIVTFNRKELLVRCIAAVLNQTIQPKYLLVIDNHSTDGTDQAVEAFQKDYQSVHYVKLPENTGGAGGFYVGMQQGIHLDVDLLWLMDDDAEPEKDALEQLLLHKTKERHIIGAAAYHIENGEEKLCWPVASPLKKQHGLEDRLKVLPPVLRVSSIPFLGFLIPVKLVKHIGLPEKAYFLSGDDTEYCAKARNIGCSIYLIASSRIKHPKPEHVHFSTRFIPVRVLLLPPWKRYYDTRNRLLTARKHYGIQLWTHTLPGTFVRWLVTFALQGNRWQQSKAFLLGILDGLLGRDGIRWLPGK